ncbi:MAG: undecaprenyl-diphosphate phosphatase, partial [Verrucomicrobiota bacterium]|nr:undecaprenyl-diphosphate phosphatase [Verrucomicrobiota bacterium]
MDTIHAIILGIIQGLTEFLPVSSSGHLEIAKKLLNVHIEENLLFTVVVHGATALSTVVVFRDDIITLLKNIFPLKYTENNQYLLKLALSMIPIGIVGVFFRDFVETFFTANLFLVGAMLLVTSLLLGFTHLKKKNDKEFGYIDAFVMGVAQIFSVLPGLSRSGATIATGLLLGNKKEETAKFSFLMILVPILGANFLDFLDIMKGVSPSASSREFIPLLIGFIAAFLTGVL